VTFPSIAIMPLAGLPEFKSGDDLAKLIVAAVRENNVRIGDGDIFVVAQKIVSKSEGKIVALDSVTPSARAIEWAEQYRRDPRVIEIVLREASRIIKMERGVIVAETRHGFVCANAGVDVSNVAEGFAVLLPDDPDRAAAELHAKLSGAFAAHTPVIVSDTFGRPWREGLVNVALGVAGMSPLEDYRGKRDASGKELHATLIAAADEIAAAAELVMRKSERIPVAIVKGISNSGRTGSGADLVRKRENDIFR
jgi:coenzyme F420-0:L-glutamate ligase / coenzyme F420-1:gamma-L-glutamate ligase